MSLEIRRATTQDWAAVRDIRLQALTEAPMAFGSTLEREQAFPEQTWRLRLEHGTTFLAVAGDAVLGTVTGLDDLGAEPQTVRLVAMYVAPPARGTGTAHRLIDAVVDAARRRGATRVLLDVTDVNTVAARCYSAYGFVPTGRRQPLSHSPWVTEVEVALTLG